MGAVRLSHKSEDMKQLCLANGWKAEVYPYLADFEKSGDVNDLKWTLYAMRGEEPALETLKVVWYAELQNECAYTYGEFYKLTPARKAPVIKLITGTPDLKKLRIPGAPEIEGPHWGELVLEEDLAAFDIMLAVVNHRIFWINRMTGDEKEAIVSVDLRDAGSARNFRVYEAPNGRRILEWADAFGFHAVGIDQIYKIT